MKKTLLIAGAAVLAIGVPALAAHHEGPKGDHPMMQDMTRADAEAKVKERFAMVDADKDGAITMASAWPIASITISPSWMRSSLSS